MNLRAIFKALPPSSQFWMLLFIFFLSYLFFSIISAFIIIPFAGIKGLEDLEKMSDYSNPSLVMGMKIAQLVGAVGSFIVPAHLFSLLASDNHSNYLKLDKQPKFPPLLLAALAMFCAMPFINWMVQVNSNVSLPAFMNDFEQRMKQLEDQAAMLTEAFLKMESPFDLFLNLFIIGFIAAFAEELFFRGAMQKALIEWTGNKHQAIWITAFVFSAIHFQFYGFLPRMMMGALLGYIFLWTGSIWVPVFAHFTNNAAAVIFSYYSQKNIISKETENIGSAPEESAYVVISIILVAGFLWALYRFQKNEWVKEEIGEG